LFPEKQRVADYQSELNSLSEPDLHRRHWLWREEPVQVRGKDKASHQEQENAHQAGCDPDQAKGCEGGFHDSRRWKGEEMLQSYQVCVILFI
jgi:hypothetical protein